MPVTTPRVPLVSENTNTGPRESPGFPFSEGYPVLSTSSPLDATSGDFFVDGSPEPKDLNGNENGIDRTGQTAPWQITFGVSDSPASESQGITTPVDSPDTVDRMKTSSKTIGSPVGSLSTSATPAPQNRVNSEATPTQTLLEWLRANQPVGADANNSQGHVHDDHLRKSNGQYRNPFDPDVLPPEKFLKWLSGNEPVENYIEVKQESVTVSSDGEANKSLLIVIVTVCGTVTICVLGVLLAICYRSRSKSMKDPSTHDAPVRFQAESKPDVYAMGSEYPNIFMGIPANNDIWKDLQNLPETATVVIPEADKA